MLLRSLLAGSDGHLRRLNHALELELTVKSRGVVWLVGLILGCSGGVLSWSVCSLLLFRRFVLIEVKKTPANTLFCLSVPTFIPTRATGRHGILRD